MATLLTGAAGSWLRTSATVVSTYPYTIAVWFKATDITGSYALASAENGNAVLNLLQAAGAIGGDPIRAMSYAGSWKVAATSSGYSASTWQHAVGVWNSATDRRVYLNGGAKGTNTDAQDAAAVNDFVVGAYKTSGITGLFVGKIAYVTAWHSALSDANAADLAAGADPTTVDGAHLVAHYPLLADGVATVGAHNLVSQGAVTYDSDTPITTYRDMSATSGGTGGGSAVLSGIYADLSATSGGTGGGSVTMEATAYVDMSAAGGGTGGGYAFFTSHIWLDEFVQVKRMVAAGSNQIWYEEI